jgi:hypothetical protein
MQDAVAGFERKDRESRAVFMLKQKEVMQLKEESEHWQ